jgi:hypothetical protein
VRPRKKKVTFLQTGHLLWFHSDSTLEKKEWFDAGTAIAVRVSKSVTAPGVVILLRGSWMATIAEHHVRIEDLPDVNPVTIKHLTVYVDTDDNDLPFHIDRGNPDNPDGTRNQEPGGFRFPTAETAANFVREWLGSKL